jgi:hypothetical protein
MIARALLLLGVLASCGSPPTAQLATIDDLQYAIYTDWESRDHSTRQRQQIEWTPNENEGKESISVLRTARPGVTSGGSLRGIERVEQLLDQAQRSLRGQFSRPARFRTQHGFAGVRVEGEFLPPGRSDRYRRIHAVLVDGDALVHVIYTARKPERRVFDIVIESLRRRGA